MYVQDLEKNVQVLCSTQRRISMLASAAKCQTTHLSHLRTRIPTLIWNQQSSYLKVLTLKLNIAAEMQIQTTQLFLKFLAKDVLIDGGMLLDSTAHAFSLIGFMEDAKRKFRMSTECVWSRILLALSRNITASCAAWR